MKTHTNANDDTEKFSIEFIIKNLDGEFCISEYEMK